MGVVNDMDMSSEVATVVWEWVRQAQATWMELLDARRQRIQGIVSEIQKGQAQGQTQTQSQSLIPLWKSPVLADVIAQIPLKVPTQLTASLSTLFQGDALPLVWFEGIRLDGRRSARIDLELAKRALEATRNSITKHQHNRAVTLTAFVSEPDINTCEHVDELETIKNIENPHQKAQLFRKFIEAYQGKREGDWIHCVVCKRECVCFHEVMELDSLAQPARMATLQKQMLVRFGGDRYEGNIVCRNCGQSLQELDFDDSVEFDDNGMPVLTSSVLTKEQESDETRIIDVVMDADSNKKDKDGKGGQGVVTTQAIDTIPVFSEPALQNLAIILQTLIEQGGIELPSEVFRRIVERCNEYVTIRYPRQKLEQTVKMSLQASQKKSSAILGAKAAVAATATATATAALETATAKQIEVALSTARVSGIAALLCIELQTAVPEIKVRGDLPTSKYFKRTGFPLTLSE
ncbi:hypothetical protein EBU99_15000, partial [bacterium]|nr:hypothetical protein [bacterium]